MKFLEEAKLAHLTSILTGMEIGERILNGRIEAFSCKKAGDDKKVSKLLDQHMKDLSASPHSSSGSPNFGPLADSGVRRVLIDLICTMNACFPDYDFGNVTPDHFAKEMNISLVLNRVNTHLAELAEARRSGFLNEVWSAIEESVSVKDCAVFSYEPDLEGDPFSDGCLWSFNYFFFNKNLKKLLFFHCTAKSKYHVMEEEEGGEEGEERGMEEDDGQRGDDESDGEGWGERGGVRGRGGHGQAGGAGRGGGFADGGGRGRGGGGDHSHSDDMMFGHDEWMACS